MERLKRFLKSEQFNTMCGIGMLAFGVAASIFVLVVGAVGTEVLFGTKAYAQGSVLAVGQQYQKQVEAARRAVEAGCENPLPTVGEWLAPGEVYQVHIQNTDTYRVQSQIKNTIRNLAPCYHIKNVELTMRSEGVYLPDEKRTVTSSVWNDSMILVVERRK